ncbi:MAG: hypothetical protein ABWX88_09505 [Pseudoxanthomonas sp.]
MKNALAASRFHSPSAVTVAVPASIAGDLKKMNQVTKEILGRLGCDGCHSGYDIRYRIERDFRVNPQLQIEEFSAGFGH